jgi:hypothetical protein
MNYGSVCEDRQEGPGKGPGHAGRAGRQIGRPTPGDALQAKPGRLKTMATGWAAGRGEDGPLEGPGDRLKRWKTEATGRRIGEPVRSPGHTGP